MNIILKNKSGKTIVEEIEETLILEEAKNRFDNEIFEVVSVSNEKINNKGTITNDRACLILQKEGVGYAVEHYCSGKDMIDIETGKLWEKVEEAIADLKTHLNYEAWEENNSY